MSRRPGPRSSVETRCARLSTRTSIRGIVALLVVAAATSGTASQAASSNVVVTMQVQSATYLDTTGCSNGATHASTVAADGPAHFWRLGETAGTTASPMLGAVSGSHTGTITVGQPGAFTGTTDGSALYGGGRTDFAGLGVNTAIGADTTVEFWMRWDGTSNVVPFGFQEYSLWIDPSDRFGFNTTNGDLWGIDGSTMPARANKWVHVVAVFRNGDVTQSKLYLDGQLQTLSKQRAGNPLLSGSYVTANGHIAGHGASAAYRFLGRIDDLAIHDGQLAPARVSAHLGAGRRGAVELGTVLPGGSAVASVDCSVLFGASSDSSMLLLNQSDRGGSAMLAGSATAIGSWPVNGAMDDISDIANPGTLSAPPNEPTYVAGDARFGQALRFDGDDFAAVAHHPSYAVSSFTVSTWFRTSSIANVAYPQLVNLGPNPTTNHQFGLTFRRDSNEFVGCASVAGVDQCAATGSAGLVDGGWHHAAMTVDAATSRLRLYVDGVERSSVVLPGTVDMPTAPIEIGGLSAWPSYRFIGDIDEVRLAAGARNASDIRAMFTGAVSDYADNGLGSDTDWSSSSVATNMFGGCLRTVEGGAVTSGTTWSADADTIGDEPAANADCGDGDADPWYPIVASTGDLGSKVATAPSGAPNPRANVRFGVRLQDGQPAGSWSARVGFTVVAPMT